MWYMDEGKTYSGAIRVIILDVLPPRLLFLKDIEVKDGEVFIQVTLNEHSALQISNSVEDPTMLEIFDAIKVKYPEYNPSFIDLKTTSTVSKYYGNNEDFFHYKLRKQGGNNDI